MIKKRFFLILLVMILMARCSDNETGDPKVKILTFDSVQEVFALVGKTIDEIGIRKEELDNDMYVIIEFDFLGNRETARALVDNRNDHTLISIRFSCDKRYEDVLEYFSDLYGSPYMKGEDPYVASKGGAVCWQRYWTGEGVVEISKGEKDSFFVCEYRLSEKPAEVTGQEEGLTFEEFGKATGYYMKLERTDFDELTIYQIDDGIYGWDFIYQGDRYEFIVTKGKADLVRQFIGREGYDHYADGTEEICTLIKDGKGEQIIGNNANDLWEIIMHENATVEKLNAMRELLEYSSWKARE